MPQVKREACFELGNLPPKPTLSSPLFSSDAKHLGCHSSYPRPIQSLFTFWPSSLRPLGCRAGPSRRANYMQEISGAHYRPGLISILITSNSQTRKLTK